MKAASDSKAGLYALGIGDAATIKSADYDRGMVFTRRQREIDSLAYVQGAWAEKRAQQMHVRWRRAVGRPLAAQTEKVGLRHDRKTESFRAHVAATRCVD